MKKTITFNDFVDEFRGSQYENQFSYDGKRALFEYLEEIEGQDKEEMELDIVAICCDFTEYDSFEDFNKDYPDIKDLEELNEYTTVLEVDNAMKTDSFIIQQF